MTQLLAISPKLDTIPSQPVRVLTFVFNVSHRNKNDKVCENAVSAVFKKSDKQHLLTGLRFSQLILLDKARWNMVNKIINSKKKSINILLTLLPGGPGGPDSPDGPGGP